MALSTRKDGKEINNITSCACSVVAFSFPVTVLARSVPAILRSLIGDAASYYKSTDFDPSCPLQISYTSQPAVDSGGVLRQFYSDLFEGLADGKLTVIFEGEPNRKVPSYRPNVVMSGLLEMLGKIISHSIAQGGPGFPFLAIPCYYYLVTADIMCAMAYSGAWDIPDTAARNIVLQVSDI